jgi:peptidoglycan/xylan/chitin deacetylase (PgdA/CDA1 family)
MSDGKPRYRAKRPIGKVLLLLGSGAFLLGAAVPLAAALNQQWGQPEALDSLLLAYGGSPTVEAFPATVSSEMMCRPAVGTTSKTNTEARVYAGQDALFRGGAFAAVDNALQPGLWQQLKAQPWPQIHPRATLGKVPILMYHDVLTEPEVFFDLVPEQLESHLKLLNANGFTAVSLDQVVQHLRTGMPLPEKPVLLTFDDGYAGHFEHVYPLLRQYQVPAVFSVFPGKLDGEVAGRSTLTWDQLKTMAVDPLVTIASHSVTHPPDLTQMTDGEIAYEVTESKRRLEEELGIPIRYFTYPAGHYDERVAQAVADAGYLAALTMRLEDEQFAGLSGSLLAIERFGQSNLEGLLDEAWGGPPAPGVSAKPFNFSAPVTITELTLEDVPVSLISGGRPVTIHADSRYQVQEILEGTNAIAGVDGGFFSLEYLNSNVMIGPVLSQSSRQFVPGNVSENPRLNGRPLVLISPEEVQFIPFQAQDHNTLAGLQRHLPDVTDAFVAAAWLVKNGEPQPASSFGSLFDFDAYRHRAFWGINHAGQPVVGVSHDLVDSVTLGQILSQAGLRDAVMVDSGASTSLVYQGESLVGYIPRPVPHVVALIPPAQNSGGPCPLTMSTESEESNQD